MKTRLAVQRWLRILKRHTWGVEPALWWTTDRQLPSTRNLRRPVDIIVEDRVHPSFLHHLTSNLEVRRVYTETPLQTDLAAEDLWLNELHSVASTEDSTIRRHTDDAAHQVLHSAAESLRGRDERTRSLLLAMEYQIQDMVYQQARRAENAVSAIKRETPGSVVIVQRSGTLTAAIESRLESMLGRQQVVRVHGLSPRIPVDVAVRNRRRTAHEHRVEIGWWSRRFFGAIRNRAVALIRRTSGNIGTSKRPTVLLLMSPAAAHIANLARVLDELTDFETIVIPATIGNASRFDPIIEMSKADPTISFDWSVARSSAAPFQRFSDLLRHLLGRRAADSAHLSRTPPRAREIDATGVLHHDLAPVLDAALATALGPRLRTLADSAGSVARVLRHYRPSLVVVVPDRSGIARATIELCRSIGVPTLFTQALYMTDGPQYRPLQTDFATAIDTFSRDVMVKGFGVAEDRVVVTGAASLDTPVAQLAPRTHPSTDVLLAFQPTGADDNIALILALARTTFGEKSYPVRFIVRPHPRESEATVDRYRSALEAAGVNSEAIDRESDLVEQIRETRIVVSGFSNVLLQAAVLERVAVSVNLRGSPFPVPFGELGIAVEANDLKSGMEILSELLADEDAMADARMRQEEYLALNPHFREASSSQRIAAEIRRRGRH